MVDTAQMLGRIRAKMERAGVSQADLAAALGLDKSAISRTLKGERKLTAGELGVVADELGVSVNVLLDRQPKRPTLLATAARIRSMATIGSDDALQRPYVRAQSLLETKNMLMRVLEPSPRPDRLAVSPSVSTYDVKAGEETAERVRAACGLGSAPIHDLEAFVEETFDVDVLIEPMAKDLEGLLLRDAETGVAMMLVNSAAVVGRQRFTLAHELGHLVFQDTGLSTPEYTSRQDKGIERRANAFAAALLVPKVVVLELSEQHVPNDGQCRNSGLQAVLTALVSQYGVSRDAAAYRMLNSGVATKDECYWLRSLPIENAVDDHTGLVDDREGATIPPSQISALAIAAYEEAIIGDRTMAEIWGTSPGEIAAALAAEGIQRGTL